MTLAAALRGHPDLATAPEDLLQEAIGEAARPLEGGLAVAGGLVQFTRRHNPTLLDFEHVPKLLSVGERIVTGELNRVLVLLGPRYFKSECFSRLLPAYYLRRFRSRSVGLVSYGADLAWDLSEEARDYYRAAGGGISGDTSAKKHWKTDRGGEMWAAGVGGPLLGKGYHLGIVDDPTDPEKAHSPTYQKRFERWWPSKFLSRKEPGAAIVVVMQRLGTEDPVDFLFRREVGEDMEAAPEHWHVVVLDEIRSDEPLGRWDGPMGLPETCTLEPDDRGMGEVLAPSRFDRAAVLAQQQAAGSYVTAAQRQQRPMAPKGDFWQKSWFQVYDELPRDAHNGGKDWDTAYTKDEANSATAWVESYRGTTRRGEDPDGWPIYIQGADWDWLEFPEQVEWMKGLQGPHYVESKATGKSNVQVLRRQKVAVHEVTVHGDKFARASGVQPVVANHRVYVHRALWDRLLLGERQGLLRVTAEQLLAGGPNLDVNDAFVQAITRHVGARKRRRHTSTSQRTV